MTSWDNQTPNKVKAKGIIWLKGIQMEKAIYLSSFCCLLEYLYFYNFDGEIHLIKDLYVLRPDWICLFLFLTEEALSQGGLRTRELGQAPSC